MTTDELAASIKAKYPDYADMDNQMLVEKITTKYPEYKQHLDPAYDTSLAGRDARIKQYITDPVGSALQIGADGAKKLGSVIANNSDSLASFGSVFSPALGPVGTIADIAHTFKTQQAVSEPGRQAGEAVTQGLDSLEQNLNGHTPVTLPVTVFNKAAGFGTAMALDPSNYLFGGAAKAGKLGKFTELATEEANKAASIMPRTIENMTRAGKSAADKAQEVGKMLLDDGVLKASAKETEKAALSKLNESGQAVGKALSDISKASKQVTGQAIDNAVEHGVSSHEVLKPLNETLQGFSESVTDARKSLAKPFENVKTWLVSKAEAQNGQLTLDNIKHVMEEVGPMTHKGAEDVQAAMSELYGTLAKMRDGMVERIASESGNSKLGENLLKANAKYSSYLHILPDIQRNAVKEALGRGPGLAEPVKYITKKAAPIVAKAASKADQIAASVPARSLGKGIGIGSLQGLNRLGDNPDFQSIRDSFFPKNSPE